MGRVKQFVGRVTRAASNLLRRQFDDSDAESDVESDAVGDGRSDCSSEDHSASAEERDDESEGEEA